MNVSGEHQITAGTISGATFKSIDIEPSIIVDGKSYTASEFNKAVEMLKQPQLNPNQQIVLEWLKNLYGCHYYQPFVSVSLFRHSFWTEKIEENYNQLDRKQQAQVLEVFSRWAQEQEEE
ncbi:hypothetical protein [Enterococcus gallinarum]|uniref:hypothetical protein n=1 Tax=Enterococcus gallinarum TaxID=1353 RepID=UPI0039A40FF8